MEAEPETAVDSAWAASSSPPCPGVILGLIPHVTSSMPAE